VSCYDLTRPFPSPTAGCSSPHSTFYPFVGHTDVKELALYVQDNISVKNWNFSLGIRGDMYNGLSVASQAEPRVGIAYNIHKTNTVLRVSYARTLETPFNENLVLSSTGCSYPVIAALVPCVSAPLQPGYRNEFHAGLQQAFGKYVVVSGEYIWKYTHNAYDFSVLDNTPITFPIAWHNSKIPGWALRVSVPNFHGFSALAVMSSVSARFFPPQIGGLGTTVESGGYPFRIDHDERFNQTLHLQYQPKPSMPWIGFNWRYDSGQVAGAAPCYGVLPYNDCPTSTTLPNGMPAVNLSGLSADQEFQAGLFCGSVRSDPYTPLPTPCQVTQYGSTLLSIPAPNTQNDDHNPQRIAPRNLFDLSVGDDNLFRGDKYKWSLQVTAINITNTYALYNFLSTFSGTHYVSPRTVTAQLGFHF
jgi:TonB dependent receptor